MLYDFGFFVNFYMVRDVRLKGLFVWSPETKQPLYFLGKMRFS